MRRPDLAAELQAMAAEDERVRTHLAASDALADGYHAQMRAVHRRNGDRVSDIIDELDGWPGVSAVGAAGARAAWLIVQHDVANPPLLRRSLPLLEAAIADGEAERWMAAYLEDRIRAFEGRSQRYGTQLDYDDDGELAPWPPVEDPEHVDDRRSAAGLGPLADHIAEVRNRSRAPDDPQAHRQELEAFARSLGWR